MSQNKRRTSISEFPVHGQHSMPVENLKAKARTLIPSLMNLPFSLFRLFSVLSAVLHIGNVQFKKVGSLLHPLSILSRNIMIRGRIQPQINYTLVLFKLK
jgi:hypothetical protein